MLAVDQPHGGGASRARGGGGAFRRHAAEVALEQLGCPALGFASGPSLSCFALGRTTGLVLDLAADGTTATAVVEGWAEDAGAVSGAFGGNALDQHLAATLEGSGEGGEGGGGGGPLWPRALRRQGMADGGALPLPATLRWLRLAEARRLKHAMVLQPPPPPPPAPPTPTVANAVGAQTNAAMTDDGDDAPLLSSSSSPPPPPRREFVLPDGSKVDLDGPLSARVCDLYFDPTPAVAAGLVPPLPPGDTGAGLLYGAGGEGSGGVFRAGAAGLPRLCGHALAHFSDREMVAALLRGVVLSGGGASLPSLAAKLQASLAASHTGLAKAAAASSSGAASSAAALHGGDASVQVLSLPASHVGLGAWVGGSIAASLRGFQELAVTKAEYDEHGQAAFDRKCP